mmetsp:Transcript_7875/g.13263  ORF Transcript_7875/g.13263 Transcript_7875/m.13263 type:complete len:256 (-) Transcript_7875:971-1738(-)
MRVIMLILFVLFVLTVILVEKVIDRGPGLEGVLKVTLAGVELSKLLISEESGFEGTKHGGLIDFSADKDDLLATILVGFLKVSVNELDGVFGPVLTRDLAEPRTAALERHDHSSLRPFSDEVVASGNPEKALGSEDGLEGSLLLVLGSLHTPVRSVVFLFSLFCIIFVLMIALFSVLMLLFVSVLVIAFLSMTMTVSMSMSVSVSMTVSIIFIMVVIVITLFSVFVVVVDLSLDFLDDKVALEEFEETGGVEGTT